VSPSLLALVLLSAFLHASWNAILKRERDKPLAGLAVLALAAVTAALAVAVVAASTAGPLLDRRGLLWSVAAGAFEGGYYLSLVVALERAPLSMAYTVSRGLAILLVWPLSVVLLGERITAPAVAGTLLLMAGLAAAGLERRRRGLLPACACGAFIAGYHLCYKGALATGRSASAVFAVSLAVALAINVARLGWRRLPALAAVVRARPVPLIAGGLLCAGSFLAFLVALRASGAGFVLTLRNSSVLFATLLAPLAGERPTRRQIAGAALVATGAMILGIGR
jgi:drug/metabolite transporter (DMT)-like permease